MGSRTMSADKETISRLRDALVKMNKDYMTTKLELDQLKVEANASSISSPQQQQKPDLGSHLLKFSSKVKAFQSNINTKLATAGLQMKGQQNENADIVVNNDANDLNDKQQQHSHVNGSNVTDKETRRLRDDNESLQTQMANYKQMLKDAMESKDQLQKERNELLIKYGEAEEEIKKLKEASIADSNRYEQLLDSFRDENSSQIEIEKKKLYKAHDAKINDLNAQCVEYKQKYEELQTKWNENEGAWNDKFDLVVTERNRIKQQNKSLKKAFSSQELLHQKSSPHKNNNISAVYEVEEEEVKSLEAETKNAQIRELKEQMNEMKKRHNNEKSSLIQRLSVKPIQTKGGADQNRMNILVNSLFNLITEKEDIITAMTESKKYLGHRLLSLEKELSELKAKQ